MLAPWLRHGSFRIGSYSEKALEMMGQGPSYGFLVAPPRCALLPI